jgi:hypothetical protein
MPLTAAAPRMVFTVPAAGNDLGAEEGAGQRRSP